MKHPRIFWSCIFLIILGLAMYFSGFSSSASTSAANPSLMLSVGILGLNVSFYAGVCISLTDFEKEPKKMFREGAVLLALDGLAYLMAGWLIRGPFAANGHVLNAWGILSLDNGSWAYGFNVLLIGIALTGLQAFEMMIFSSSRALKQRTQKPRHVTPVSAHTDQQV